VARIVTFPETDRPGAYRVRTAGDDDALSERKGDLFVVNVDPRESDPARLPPERRPGADEAQKAQARGVPPPTHRVDLWHGLAALIVGFVFVESLLTLRHRRREADTLAA
jgi:hypothetical protein